MEKPYLSCGHLERLIPGMLPRCCDGCHHEYLVGVSDLCSFEMDDFHVECCCTLAKYFENEERRGNLASIYRRVFVNERLKNRDYYLLIDRSGSMGAKDEKGGKSRFAYAQESTVAVARVLEEFDPDGITVIPFNGSFSVKDNTTSTKVEEIFKENQPAGSTELSGPLNHCFKDYLDKKSKGEAKANGAMVVVLTDGVPDSEEAVAKAIKDFTHKLENGDDEFGILFLQVGHDGDASKFLKRLDDNLTGAKFDIVDAKTIDELENLSVLDALLAALDD